MKKMLRLLPAGVPEPAPPPMKSTLRMIHAPDIILEEQRHFPIPWTLPGRTVPACEITGVCRLPALFILISQPSIPSDSYQPPCDLPPRRECPGSSSRFCQKSCKHKTHKSVPRGSGLVQLNGADEVSAIAATSHRPLLFCFFFDTLRMTIKPSPLALL